MAMLCGAPNKYISINPLTVNVTGYCRLHGRVAGHIPFASLGSHTHTNRLRTSGPHGPVVLAGFGFDDASSRRT
jgi:hypothetical protein